MKTVFMLLSLLVASFSMRAMAFEVVGPSTIRIHVLSYNIKGLPAIINPDWDQDRFKDIGEILAARRHAGTGPDIVFLQESFGERTLELQAAAGYPFRAVGPSNSKIISSGLYILSNYPITYNESLLYGNFDCGTWDCFASKGALAARIQLPGVPFELLVATTHAQAEAPYNSERATQLVQYADFLKALINPSVGIITGGDFNTFPKRPSYKQFVARSGFTSVGETCVVASNGCSLVGKTDPSNLLLRSDDQFFFQNGTRVSVRPVSVERNFHDPVKGRMLSDHYGYETTFEISWK